MLNSAQVLDFGAPDLVQDGFFMFDEATYEATIYVCKLM